MLIYALNKEQPKTNMGETMKLTGQFQITGWDEAAFEAFEHGAK
ncbi:hypothetical protein PALB_8670 [Pseudoalteromonas luteoviolacea B = ATCC 29581]|nr:hypothetical protein PALB_8670 [Pseudoalteromonas luteoviolacea B = ATCC 29581]